MTVFSDWDGDGDSELDEDEFTERWDASLMGEQWTTTPMSKDQFKANFSRCTTPTTTARSPKRNGGMGLPCSAGPPT